ncbi:protein-arginine deiminase family protein [Streptomyces tibetensis]
MSGDRVSYVDDWCTHSLGMGEVYCGTDTPRDATSAWWQRPVAHRNEE